MSDFNDKIDSTADNNNKGIAFEKEGKIDDAIAVYEDNAKLGYPATHSYERLMILYSKRGEKENEARIINRALEVFGSTPKYEKRLAKLEGTYIVSGKILPKSAQEYNIEGVPLGVLFEQTIKELPEFNFYADMQEGGDTVGYLYQNKHLVNDGKYKKEIWRIQSKFKTLISNAENHAEEGRLDKAAKIYERLLSEQYYLPTPYDRLIKIYSKAKLKSEELRVLEYSIAFFTELRNTQKEYVTYLASKYGKLDFANERIDNDKKISYYGGAFELYNPYPVISTWEKRLSKLK